MTRSRLTDAPCPGCGLPLEHLVRLAREDLRLASGDPANHTHYEVEQAWLCVGCGEIEEL